MKKILIIYPDPFLSYSPTTLNLHDSLAAGAGVSILTFEPDPKYSSHRITDRNVNYIPVPPAAGLIKRLARKVAVKTGIKDSTDLLRTPKAEVLIKSIKQFDGEIIAVDFFALWCAQKAGKKAHFLSLEIYQQDKYKDACDPNAIKSVIIQSDERYNYLFGHRQLKKFLVPNAPAYIDEPVQMARREKKNLIFCGSAIPGFGIFSCIEFINDFPEYTLSVKGAVPQKIKEQIENNFSSLLKTGRLILNDQYMEPAALNRYVGDFRIGFVFYDFYRFENIDTFNYKTAPSGKLFQYYNAGIPVIGNNVPGLSSITQYKTGIQISTMGSLAIKRAIDEIESNYEGFAMNSKKASENFDFNRNVGPFVDFLNGPNKS